MPSPVSDILRDLRVKLRDDGTRRRYSDRDLLIFVKNSLHRLFREERSAYFGISDAPATIAGLELTSEMPVVDASWESRIMNDSYAEAENINQEGTRPEVANQLQREEKM